MCLIDLAGHTGGNRLLVFARRPARVQMTWPGYEGTTGLEGIDHLIADEPASSARGRAPVSRERVLQLPGGYAGYAPPAAPSAGPTPALSGGRVTFGGSQQPGQAIAAALAAFADVPDAARLPRLVPTSTAAWTTRRSAAGWAALAAAGVDASRVDPPRRRHPRGLLPAYREVSVRAGPVPSAAA